MIAHLNFIQPGRGIVASFVLFAIFSIYWELQKKNSSAATVSESKPSRWLHVIAVNAGMLLVFIAVPGLRHRFLPAVRALIIIGLALETASLALAIWARRTLGRHWSGEITIKVEHQLIRSGPYRFVRHPIYTAILGMMAGAAIVSGELHALIGFTLTALAYARKVYLEEANLLTAFGDDYRAYKRETSALIPGIF